MKCPKCEHTKSDVTDSRPEIGLESTRRRRRCRSCDHRWSTYEIREDRVRQLSKIPRIISLLDKVCEQVAEIKKA